MADLYGRNKVENPGAETGDLTGWSATAGVSAVAGGHTGSYSFLLDATAQMYQTFAVSTAPPDYLAEVSFLPAYDAPLDGSAKAWVEVRLEYSGGYWDYIRIPLRQEAPEGGV